MPFLHPSLIRLVIYTKMTVRRKTSAHYKLGLSAEIIAAESKMHQSQTNPNNYLSSPSQFKH